MADNDIADTESIFSLVLNPEEWEEVDEWQVYDCGEVDEEESPSCPSCKKVYKGKSEAGHAAWLARHIRLHNIQARRKNLCTIEEMIAEGPSLCEKVLDDIASIQTDTWHPLCCIATELKEGITSELFRTISESMCPVLHSTSPIFFRDEYVENLKEFHQLLINQEFRGRCLALMQSAVFLAEDVHLQQFLTAFLRRLKDKLSIFKLSKIKEKMPVRKRDAGPKRDRLIFYIGGWMLFKVKKACWRSIKNPVNSQRFQCLNEYFLESGAHAEPVVDKVREWVDAKNRGKKVGGFYVSGLSIPSAGAYQFFHCLDNIIQTFEASRGLTAPLSKESIFEKVYDDLELLQFWNKITPEIPPDDQQSFLECIVDKYRCFAGHANAKRLERTLPRKATVATRTNLKRNPTAQDKEK